MTFKTVRKNASKYVGWVKKTFRIHPDVEDALREYSHRTRVDLSEIVDEALRAYLVVTPRKGV